jgi:hypothetical protein
MSEGASRPGDIVALCWNCERPVWFTRAVWEQALRDRTLMYASQPRNCGACNFEAKEAKRTRREPKLGTSDRIKAARREYGRLPDWKRELQGMGRL